MGNRDGFVEFAEASAARLRRTAYLLCGEWHLAEDLAQIALERVYVHWRRVEKAGNPEAYAKRVLFNAYLDRKRRRSSSEVLGLDVETADGAVRPAEDGIDLGLTLIGALRLLAPLDRAVVVLRYWEDHSVDTVAEMLGVSSSAVRNRSSRALSRLRELLVEDPSTLWARPPISARGGDGRDGRASNG